MTLQADALEDGARQQTGLDDFGDGGHREGLERLITSMNEEADLTEVGEVVQQSRLGMLLVVAPARRTDLPGTPRDREPGGARTRLHHRAPPHRHHRAEPTGGLRSAVPLAAAVGVELALPAPGGSDPAHRPPHRRDGGRPGHDARDVPAHGEHAPRGRDDADRVPGPAGHDLPHRPLRRHGPGPELHGLGHRVRHARHLRATTAGCSTCCSGTARPGCGTSRRRCTCSPSTHCWRRIPTPSSSGATGTPPPSWARSAASCTTSAAGAATATTRWSSAPSSSTAGSRASRRAMDFRERMRRRPLRRRGLRRPAA